MSDNEIKNNDDKVTDKAFVIAGNVDAGKSTLIGVMTSGILDDGRGTARKNVARHKHEIESGKTSDVTSRVIRSEGGNLVTLIDVCGHEKFQKTTISGISGMWPDYGIIVASPSRGILEMTRQHFKLLVSYNIPMMIVVTKVDASTKDSCKLLDQSIKKICKNYKKNVEFMNTYDDYIEYEELKRQINDEKGSIHNDDKIKDKLQQIEEQKENKIKEIIKSLQMATGKQTTINVIYVSNVNGYFIDVLKKIIYYVEPRDIWRTDDESNNIIRFFKNKLNLQIDHESNNGKKSIFYIDQTYHPKGIGIVCSGINRGENVNVGDALYIGPINGKFTRIKIKSIHNDNRTEVSYLGNHHRGCFQIKPIEKIELKRNMIRRGMIMASDRESCSNVCRRFKSAISVFGTHSATLKTGYTPVIHAGTVRQSAIMETEDINKIIKINEVEIVTFKFVNRSEYLEKNSVFIFRSGDIHGIGMIIEILK
jgi:elongation factor 1-alpha